MAASFPMSAQLGAIAVRRMSTPRVNSRATASQRDSRSLTSPVSESGWGGRRTKIRTVRHVASEAATAMISAAAASTRTATQASHD
jgi:hypothetical protein